ncbi:MAG: MFS transporter, partial [Betaproteobacteria bacterium]|nr:MFS transporter [Betaproteobacteria bacterium]
MTPARNQALAIVLLGSVIAPLDSSVNAAFPAINAAFALEVASIRWVVISYLVAFSSCVIVSGRLGDLFGYRRVFGIGLLVSTAAFLGCGFARDYDWLLVARTVQGVGIALVLGAAPALALSIFPESERTRVLARFGAAFAIGLAVGPAAGGVLVDAFGWQAVYFARVPLALGSWLLLARVPVVPQEAGRRFDASSSALLATWTGSLMLAIALPGPAGIIAVLLAAVTFSWFVWRESRASHPTIRLSLFRSAAFSVPNLAAVLVHFTGFVIFLLGPFLFVSVLGLTAQVAGILLALGPVGAVFGSALAARLVARVGARRAAFAGMLLNLAVVAVAVGWDGATGIVTIGCWLALGGLGIGLFQVAYSDLVIAALPPGERGVASSLTNFTRTLGVVTCAVIGSALFRSAESAALATGAAGGVAFLKGYAHAVSTLVAGVALFIVLTLLRPRV